MFKLVALVISLMTLTSAADLPTKKWLNLAAIKTMVAAAEAEAQKRNVQVTLCIVDESGNLLFLQKADGAGLNTIQFAQKKARHAALYGRPSKDGADQLKSGNLQVLVFPNAFPNQGGLPQRTREIGIRMALGAGRADVLKLVLRRSLLLIGVGLVAGLGGSLALTRLIESQLWGVTATDPATFIIVSLLLILIALTATFIPTRRAVQVDPTVALRYE